MIQLSTFYNPSQYYLTEENEREGETQGDRRWEREERLCLYSTQPNFSLDDWEGGQQPPAFLVSTADPSKLPEGLSPGPSTSQGRGGEGRNAAETSNSREEGAANEGFSTDAIQRDSAVTWVQPREVSQPGSLLCWALASPSGKASQEGRCLGTRLLGQQETNPSNAVEPPSLEGL